MLKRLVNCSSGAVAAEYSLILALVGTAVAAGAIVLGFDFRCDPERRSAVLGGPLLGKNL